MEQAPSGLHSLLGNSETRHKPTAAVFGEGYRRNALAVQARLTSEDGLSETVRRVDVILRG